MAIPLAAGLAFIAALAIWAATAPGSEHEIGSYVTSLAARSDSQIHNVALAARAINNAVILPGRIFSFNKTVGSWTADVGYEKAPVSYDGELVRSWGGGVCQTSTTLYNAALLAGLAIVERHRHHWPARYAPLGRDAAAAYEVIDLKFRNDLPEPVRIAAAVRGGTLVVSILSRYRPPWRVDVQSIVRSVQRPSEVIQGWAAGGQGRRRLVNRGHPGFDVVTYRLFIGPSGTRRELISEDRYPAMDRVVRIAER